MVVSYFPDPRGSVLFSLTKCLANSQFKLVKCSSTDDKKFPGCQSASELYQRTADRALNLGKIS